MHYPSYTIYTVHYALHNIHYPLVTIHYYTLFSVYYTIHHTLFTVHYHHILSPYTIHYTPYTITVHYHDTLSPYTITVHYHHTLYTIHSLHTILTQSSCQILGRPKLKGIGRWRDKRVKHWHVVQHTKEWADSKNPLWRRWHLGRETILFHHISISIQPLKSLFRQEVFEMQRRWCSFLKSSKQSSF